jgi:hypothetical protein
MEGCHENGDPTNNRLANLRWDTPGNNNLDKQRHGTDHQRNKLTCPLDHLLSRPNLKPSELAKGRRSCLACNRAHAQKSRAVRRGQDFDFRAYADAAYARLLPSITGACQLAIG